MYHDQWVWGARCAQRLHSSVRIVRERLAVNAILIFGAWVKTKMTTERLRLKLIFYINPFCQRYQFSAMALPEKSMNGLFNDVEAHPNHVASQQTGSTAQNDTQPEQPATKDLEGITDTFASPDVNPSKPGMGKKRQKKVAVLTSGGDSAGMNAAGTSSSFPLLPGYGLTEE